MNQPQYAGAVAALYNSGAALSHPMNQLTHATWLEKLGDVEGKYILDLACGGGHSSRLLAVRSAYVTGVDLSQDMINHAQALEERSPLGITYRVGDAATLDLGKTFEIVTPSFLFHYASSLNELRAYMETVRRHLIPGGRMVALHAWKPIVPRMENAGHWSEWVDPSTAEKEGAKIRLHVLDRNGDEVLALEYYYWTQKTYESMLRACGFKAIQCHTYIVPHRFRKQWSNWSQIERSNTSCVMTAQG